MTLVTLVAALVCLLAWAVLTFVLPVGLGVVHVLLGVGASLLVRWWVIRGDRAGGLTGGPAGRILD